MPKSVAILQSNYIPWKGYFDLIRRVDEFILYDDMQYTKNDWRNRNRIKTKSGIQWLTIPVVTESLKQRIKDTRVVSGSNWQKKHLATLRQSYAKAPYFKHYHDVFADLYNASSPFLSEINYEFLTTICRLLKINTKISWSSDYQLADGKTERLIALCKQAGADSYLSGPSAKNYLDESLFVQNGIDVTFIEYHYPEYPQLFPPFEHAVSIVDLLFNVGPNAMQYIATDVLDP